MPRIFRAQFRFAPRRVGARASSAFLSGAGGALREPGVI